MKLPKNSPRLLRLLIEEYETMADTAAGAIPRTVYSDTFPLP
ncbi:MAG: hypothetical protein ACRD0U_02375 [Acidimicrobiales bacterium]